MAALLLLTGFATGYPREFSVEVVQTWLWAAPATGWGCSWSCAPQPGAGRLQGPCSGGPSSWAGMTIGCRLAERIRGIPYSRIKVLGFVDSRAPRILRLEAASRHKPDPGTPTSWPAWCRTTMCM